MILHSFVIFCLRIVLVDHLSAEFPPQNYALVTGLVRPISRTGAHCCETIAVKLRLNEI